MSHYLLLLKFLRDFGSRLYAFMRIVLPQADVRQSLWKSLIPVNAPVVPELDFVTLGRKFELYPGSIQSAIAHAAAEAASRPLDKQKSKHFNEVSYLNYAKH